jgi:hypothetical protein
MPMKPQEISPVPEETARVARAANPKGTEFRTRLLTGAAEMQLLQALLELYKRRGWLKVRGRQRTDGGACAGGYS